MLRLIPSRRVCSMADTSETFISPQMVQGWKRCLWRNDRSPGKEIQLPNNGGRCQKMSWVDIGSFRNLCGMRTGVRVPFIRIGENFTFRPLSPGQCFLIKSQVDPKER